MSGRCHQSSGWQGWVTHLGRPHAHGGVALDQLHISIADLRGVDDIAHLQIFVEVDEVLAFGVRENRPWEIDWRFRLQRQWLDVDVQAKRRNDFAGGASGLSHNETESAESDYVTSWANVLLRAVLETDMHL